MNDIRNELLLILGMQKEKTAKDKQLKLEWLLERFQYDIKRQLEDARRKQKELEENLETLEYVTKELNIKLHYDNY